MKIDRISYIYTHFCGKGVESYINLIVKLMLSRCILRFGFSAEQAVAQKTFAKFNERYSANLEEFKKKVSSANNQA